MADVVDLNVLAELIAVSGLIEVVGRVVVLRGPIILIAHLLLSIPLFIAMIVLHFSWRITVTSCGFACILTRI